MMGVYPPRTPLSSPSRRLPIDEATRLAAAGDNAAREYLFKRLRPIVANAVQRFRIDGYDLDDLVQEGLVACFEELPKTPQRKTQKDFDCYFWGVAFRQAWRLWRDSTRRKRIAEHVSLEALADLSGDLSDGGAGDPERLLFAVEVVDLARANTRPADLEIVQCYADGHGTADIVAATGLTEAQVRKSLRRVRDKMRDVVREEYGEEVGAASRGWNKRGTR